MSMQMQIFFIPLRLPQFRFVQLHANLPSILLKPAGAKHPRLTAMQTGWFNPVMIRSLTFFLLMVFIPLQASWAVAANYLGHDEQGQQTAHFGHHQDEHNDDERQLPQQHHDHSHSAGFVGCFAGTVQGAVIDFTSPRPRANLSKYSFFCQTRPERPKWPVSA